MPKVKTTLAADRIVSVSYRLHNGLGTIQADLSKHNTALTLRFIPQVTETNEPLTPGLESITESHSYPLGWTEAKVDGMANLMIATVAVAKMVIDAEATAAAEAEAKAKKAGKS
jgi:hypothetical protein